MYDKQVPICTACFQNATASRKSDFSENHSGIMLDGLAKALMNFQPVDKYYAAADTKSSGVVCSNCGFEFEEYYDRGRFGCVKCYDVFHSQIKSVVYKIHGCVRHNGSRPV